LYVMAGSPLCEPDAQTRLMVHNPIKGYSIGDRTPGLRYDKDGSLTVYIQHEHPGPEREANWLPEPEHGFSITARAYLPDQSMPDGTYRLPALHRV